MPLSIDLAVEHDAWTEHLARTDHIAATPEALVSSAVAAALTQVPAVTDGAELSVVLCDDAFIRRLNAQWRGKDKATNVLSFPAPDAMRDRILGDIVVAYETSAGEAAERGTPLAGYLSHLIVHGVLHLLGLDHEDDAQAGQMEALETRALATLGIASPYADETPATQAADQNRPEGAAGLRVTSLATTPRIVSIPARPA